MIQVVWFKRDLRIEDHAPLAAAASAGPVLPLYVAEPEYWHLPDVSARQWITQRAALDELSQSLAVLGAPLIVRVGNIVEILERIYSTVGIARLLAHEETGNLWTFKRDIAVRAFCKRCKIPFQEFSQTGVLRGTGARDQWAAHFGRFTSAPLTKMPERLVAVPQAKIAALPMLETLGLQEDGCLEPQLGTRQAALGLLDSFLDGRGANYRRGMSSPLSGATACSRLSVPLATGAVSVREVLQRLYAARRPLVDAPPTARAVPVTALDSLIARLHWRSHFTQKLESEPELEVRSFHPAHQGARTTTAPDDPMLNAWATGQSGIPFIDACMRSLIATGWLNFRMRAMVQSFASYHLGLDWRVSGERLARLFSDYEPGIHWPQVQMQSGQTGINTPRIYNPVKQGRDQDPDGRFTRQWVPELARVPLAVLQTPWLATGAELASYPQPIVEPETAARLAKDRLTALRRSAGYREAALEVLKKHGSRKRQSDRKAPSGRLVRRIVPPLPSDQLSLQFADQESSTN
ncbi:MAG: FAD-binding domain-containing protein [Acidocella sp.]|nr:FAD-binding domain-containing protein [Acidocella sp.]